MSSFIVSEDCMNDIINGLFMANSFNNENQFIERAGYVGTPGFQRLGDDLLNLNARGTGQRYKDEKMLLTIHRFKWDKERHIPSAWQVLKSLRCLHYQCSEGDTEKTEMFKFLDELLRRWTDYLIDKIPEYAGARWD